MILLDTHTWVWFAGMPDMLSKRARKAIDHAVDSGTIYLSCISTWEIALLVKRKRLTLSIGLSEWLKHSERLTFLQFIPVDNTIVMASVSLKQPIHPDPADRIIIATAIQMGIPIITKDKKLIEYPYVTTIW